MDPTFVINTLEIVLFIPFIALLFAVLFLLSRIRLAEYDIKTLKVQRQSIDEILGTRYDLIKLKSDLRNIDYSNKYIYIKGEEDG